MIEGKFVVGYEALETTGLLRYEVFTEELGMPISVEKDVYDHFAHHLIVRDGEEFVATGRLIIKDGEFIIGRIAVDPKARGNHYGDLIVRMLVDRAFNLLKAERVVVHSMLPVQDFYTNIGFKAEGEPYIEATIEHITMSIEPGGLNSTCCGCNGC